MVAKLMNEALLCSGSAADSFHVFTVDELVLSREP